MANDIFSRLEAASKLKEEFDADLEHLDEEHISFMSKLLSDPKYTRITLFDYCEPR